MRNLAEDSPPPMQRPAHSSRMKVGKKDQTPKPEENLTHTLVTIAPDGGWGWIILAVSTWDTLCIDGVSLAYAVIQNQVIEYLQITDVQSSMFVSVFNCLVYLLGPATAALANRFGFRILNLVGGALGAVALAACCFSHTFYLSIFLFSVVTGIGGSLIYMVSMAAPGYWFEKRRSLAFGVSNSATGFSCVLIPPLCKLVAGLNWKMVFMFVACMLFVAFLGGFLIRKPPMVLVEVEGYSADNRKPVNMSMSILNVRGGGGANRNVEEKMKQMSYHALQTQSKPGVPLARQRLSIPSMIVERKSCWQRMSPCCANKNDEIEIERPLYKSDIFLTSRVDVKKSKKNEAEQLLDTHKKTTEKDITQQLGGECHCCPEAIKRPLKDMLSLPLLKNFVYLTFLLATMLYYSAIYVTYLYVPRTCERKGLGEDTGIMILQLFGGFLAISRISLGVIFYFWPNLPPHYFTSAYVTLGGACHFCLAFTTNKIALYVLGSAMGFLCGVWVPMRSVLVVRYLGLEQLTNAMGMLFVFQAVGSLYGAPIAQGLSAAVNEDYMAYYFAGTMYAAAGALALPLECLNNCMKRRKGKNKGTEEV